MPAYPWLAATELDFKHIADDMKVNANLGVPYTKEMIEAAAADVKAQAKASVDALYRLTDGDVPATAVEVALLRVSMAGGAKAQRTVSPE